MLRASQQAVGASRPVAERAPFWLVQIGRAAIAPIVALVAVLGCWYATKFMFGLPDFILPLPQRVLGTFLSNLPALVRHTWITTIETAGGLALAIVVGVLLSVVMFEVELLRRAILPWLVVSQAIPKVAIAPLIVVWFGFSVMPKIVIAFFIAFFPIVISTTSGLVATNEDEEHLFNTMTKSAWRTYQHLRIPRALPLFFDGVKVAVTLALVGAVVGEFVSSQAGLGYLVIVANRDLDTAMTFAAFIALAIIGILFFYAVVLVERLLIPWHFAQRRLTGR